MSRPLISQSRSGGGPAPPLQLNRTRSNQSSQRGGATSQASIPIQRLAKQVEQTTSQPSKPQLKPSLNNNNKENKGDVSAGVGGITPELLVDALSGHEDGLLAIAERLMEHYDKGYDVMGEAIIDAFADVQKLFQHAVEAAHMEGAAMEASRARETGPSTPNPSPDKTQSVDPKSPNSPPVIEEFVDEDVKDTLREAIDNVSKLQQNNKSSINGSNKQQQPMEWYEIYERACNSASALLPVDSDHRGRLQLAIARAENVPPDRACALLRYAMEDVIRSGTPTGKVAPQDLNKRSDCVLEAPTRTTSSDDPLESINNSSHAVLQSNDEQLDSLVEEMREVLSAPMYEDSPIQFVALRFWEALKNTRKYHAKREEILSQKLGELKGDFLLEKAEWEEKLSESHADLEKWKRSYLELKDNSFRLGGNLPSSPTRVMSEVGAGCRNKNDDLNSFLNRISPSSNTKNRAESVFSQASSMANQAKKMLACGREEHENSVSRSHSNVSYGKSNSHFFRNDV